MTDDNIDFLLTLERVIDQRKSASEDESYTARLLSAGPARIAQKVGEEGVELALAGAAGSETEIVAEAADLMYHMMVLLKSYGLGLADVAGELERRHR
jgi:phosphoribosyl-ATP pyrophosphohydrolase/phosphoribosyl-AMP cyclohydrolase